MNSPRRSPQKSPPAFWIALFILAFLIGACNPAPAATVNPANIPDEPNSIHGQILGTENLWPEAEVWVFAAPYHDGVYMLDPERHPHTRLEKDGAFILKTVPPGTYVLLVGPEATEAVLVKDDQGAPRVVRLEQDQQTRIGKINLP